MKFLTVNNAGKANNLITKASLKFYIYLFKNFWYGNERMEKEWKLFFLYTEKFINILTYITSKNEVY